MKRIAIEKADVLRDSMPPPEPLWTDDDDLILKLSGLAWCNDTRLFRACAVKTTMLCELPAFARDNCLEWYHNSYHYKLKEMGILAI